MCNWSKQSVTDLYDINFIAFSESFHWHRISHSICSHSNSNYCKSSFYIFSLKLAGILHLLFRLLCFFFSLVFCSCLLAFCAVLSLPICGILPRKDGNLDTIPNLFTQCYCHRIDCNPLILIPFSTSKTDECRWCLNSQSTTERVRER